MLCYCCALIIESAMSFFDPLYFTITISIKVNTYTNWHKL